MEIAKELPLDKYDAVATMSGDGLIHEVLNGFWQHADPIRALRTPVAPVPTGSANGLCLNILGMQVRAMGRPDPNDPTTDKHMPARRRASMSPRLR